MQECAARKERARVLHARVRCRGDTRHDRGGLRHTSLKVGPTTVLHPFQILEGPPPPPMFSRGRLDHFALLAPSEGAFKELRHRIEAEGAADGEVRDMRAFWIMGYFDPDGAAHEVVLQRPGFADSDMLERAAWTTVTLEQP